MRAVFELNLKKFNAIPHTKKFCTWATARNAFADTNLLLGVISEPKKFIGAVCQDLT